MSKGQTIKIKKNSSRNKSPKHKISEDTFWSSYTSDHIYLNKRCSDGCISFSSSSITQWLDSSHSPPSLTPSVFLLPLLAFLPSPPSLPSPSWHSALSLIVDNWVGGPVGWPCLCVQRASGQVNGALVSSWEHSVSLFLSSIILLDSQSQSATFMSSLKLFLLFRSSFPSFPAASCWLSFHSSTESWYHFPPPLPACIFRPLSSSLCLCL